MKKIRLFFLIMCAMLPSSFLKNMVYQLVFGFKIGKKVKIHFGAVILADIVSIGNDTTIQAFSLIHSRNIDIGSNSKIYRKCFIKGLSSFEIGNDVIFGANTTVYARYKGVEYQKNWCNFKLGNKSVVSQNTMFDCTDNISIGSNVVLGGGATCFFTHGYDIQRNRVQGDIRINDDCYIGTRCIFCPGVYVTSGVLICPGTVVYKNIVEKGMYSSAQLVKINDTTTFSKKNKILIANTPEPIWRIKE
ncbi:DapH/DapD/GlmU-related protein [Treponema sp. HNW]|uniref:DapH/DapD/GlmU-related protein n=1 Tax=Treponema sp. HNW TaxID=3116654 RepID=UPI003D0CEBCA